MRTSKISFVLAALVAALCLAQTASDLESPQVNRVAEKLNCPCGCSLTMTCRMEPYMCGTCKRAKTKIIEMQGKGMSDAQILDDFAKENGKQIVVTPPGTLGVVGPVAFVLIGLGAVLLIMRQLMRRRPASTPDVDPAVLERIEKDLSKLD